MQNGVLKQNQKPNLVLIQGKTATRYVDGKAAEVAEIDPQNNRHLAADIEYFRVNGLDFEEETSE